MTTDYEKYKVQAERLADQANHFTYGDGGDAAVGHALAAEAQVYATLALAAATVRPEARLQTRVDAGPADLTLEPDTPIPDND